MPFAGGNRNVASTQLTKVSVTFSDIVGGDIALYNLEEDQALVNVYADVTTVFDGTATAVTIGDPADLDGWQQSADWTAGTGLTGATRGAYVSTFKGMRSTSGTIVISAYNVDLGTAVEAGATADANASITYLTYKQITGLTSGDTIKSVTGDIYNTTATSFKGGVYDDNSNQPGTLLTNGGNDCVGELTNQTISNTYTTMSIPLDYTATVPANGIVWVAIVPNTNNSNYRVTAEGGSSYAHSVYATGSVPSGLFSNYANMLYSTANISGDGTNNVRFGVMIDTATVTQGAADIYLEVAK